MRVEGDGARLAQAAPDMLAALKLALPLLEREFLHMAHSGTNEGKAIAAARAAIAKAEGKEFPKCRSKK